MGINQKIEKTVDWLREKVKEAGCKGLVVGVSGGIDSAVVCYIIKKAFPDIKTETVILKTTGDKITDKPLYAIGGKGLFVNEFEDALLKGEIDMAVHSAKDMPSKTEEPFCIPAVLKRGNP